MAVPVETLSIQLGRTTHAFPIISLLDRRGRQPYRQKQWCLIRAIEKLTHDVKTRSTGAFANHLEACSMADAILVAEKAAVTSGVLLQEEFEAVLATMRPLIEDVESRMKVRKCSLVPLTITTSALAELGRSDATTAILKALNKLPKKWQLEIEQEENYEMFGPNYCPGVDDVLKEMEEEGCDEV